MTTKVYGSLLAECQAALLALDAQVKRTHLAILAGEPDHEEWLQDAFAPIYSALNTAGWELNALEGQYPPPTLPRVTPLGITTPGEPEPDPASARSIPTDEGFPF